MQSWIIPFIYIAVILGVYLLSPENNRAMIQKRIRRDLDFYIVADLILIVLAISSTLAYRQHWLQWISIAALIVAAYVSLRKAVTTDRRPE